MENEFSVKLTGALQFCDGRARSTVKAREVRKKTYMKASHPGGRMFVEPTGTFMDILIGNWYWLGVVDDHKCYSLIFFTKIKWQLPKKMEELFEKIAPRGNPVKYLCCYNAV